MNATIQKWGNSLALRIPKTVARETCLDSGSVVSLTVEDGKVVIEPLPKTKYHLDDLLKGVSIKNIHPIVETGPPVGREIW